MKKIILLFGLFSLYACGSPAERSNKEASIVAENSSPSAGKQSIALDYSMGLKIPESTIETSLKNHRSLCEKAGADKCQILSYNYNNSNGPIDANLNIRAVPSYILPFRDSLSSEALKLGGKVEFDSTNAVNLTSEISTQTDLVTQNQDDINKIKRDLKRNDLTEGERSELELSLNYLNQNINTNQKNLADSKTRVEMSILNITYNSKKGGITKASMQPVVNAIENIWEIFFYGVSVIIMILAAITPFGIVFLIYNFAKRKIESFKTKKDKAEN